jgi:23S rRNA pseudouridine1911/1915/1917 synthase
MNHEFEIIVAPGEKGQRLDHFLPSKAEPNISRSQVKRLIEKGNVLVNKQSSKPSYKVKLDDRIKIVVPTLPSQELKPEPIPLAIIYEDPEIIAVNKPKGLVVHPGAGNMSGTLVNALLQHCGSLSSLGGDFRPGIVHRLDKDTTGVIVAAKTDLAYNSLVKQFKSHQVEKSYLALVHGNVKKSEGKIEAGMGRHPINRKKMSVVASRESRIAGQKIREAITAYKVMERFKDYTLLEVKIKTGRTHQIRVHLNYIGHPVVGDQTYGKRKEKSGVKGQLLHAYRLSINHPVSGGRMEFEARLPEEMQKLLVRLRNE